MTKKMDVQQIQIASFGTANTWYKGTDMSLLANNGSSDIRVDKAMIQLTGYCTNAVAGAVIGVLVHFSDETGAVLTSGITNGSTTDAQLEVILNQWKDAIFMTDFRVVGTGFAQSMLNVIPLEADTRRILKPGQTMYLTLLTEPLATETTKSTITFVDSILWYSAAAN